MLELTVEVEDWDTNQSIWITLPCNISDKIDKSHDIQIVDWKSDVSLGGCDDVVRLNDIFEKINIENPEITIEILEKISKTVFTSLNDENFIQKICDNDFMLNEIKICELSCLNSDEQRCAYYLATELMIPFAKNINENELKKIKRNIEFVDWDSIWKYYLMMGFKIFKINNSLFVLNWYDA